MYVNKQLAEKNPNIICIRNVAAFAHKADLMYSEESSACGKSCVEPRVALEKLCHVWENNHNDNLGNVGFEKAQAGSVSLQAWGF